MEIATVLDVGSSKVTCLVAEPDTGEGISVLAVGTAPCTGVKRGVVVDVDATSRAIKEAIAQVEGKLGTEVDDLYVSVNGAHIEGSKGQGMVPIHPRLRAITREDVLQVLNHSRQVPVPNDRELLHTMPREFVVDGEHGIHRPIGMNAGRLEVITYTLTANAESLAVLDQAIGSAGKHVGAFIAGPLGSGMGVLSAQDIELGSVCVDIGAGKTDVAVFAGGSLIHSACIPIGSNLVSSDIAHLVRTSLETADHLKTSYGAASASAVPDKDSVEVLQLGQIQARPMQRKVLCEIIESRMRELAGFVKASIDASGRSGGLPGGIALTGGGSLLPGTVELFESVLGNTSVRLGRPVPVLPPMAVTAPPASAFAAAVGIARFAFDSYEDELAPASGGDWKSKVRSLWSLFGSKP